MNKLELYFQNDLESRMYIAKKECKYNPSRFNQMLLQYGGVETAKRLIQKNEVSDGFITLYLSARLDLTMEATVIEDKYASLFTKEEIVTCQNRLKECGYIRGSKL